jgi:hypothetical protein
MPREQWDALARGENCPVCAELASDRHANEEGFFVADLDLSRLRLARNQYVQGYPRYYRDPAPHRPLDPAAGHVALTPKEYAQRIDRIRAALQ